MSTVDDKGSVPPRPTRLERLQRTDQDFHRVMSDFDELMALAHSGQLTGGAMAPPKEPLRHPSFGIARRAPSEQLTDLPSQHRLEGVSALESRHAPGSSAHFGTPPISAGGHSMVSRASSSDSSVSSSAQRSSRTLPPLAQDYSNLRHRVSPRPNSVPLHPPECLILAADDETRPSSTQDFVASGEGLGTSSSCSPYTRRHLNEALQVEALLVPKMSAQSAELRRELEEIEDLRRKREEERLQRQRDREERRRQRTEAATASSNVWQQPGSQRPLGPATCSSSNNQVKEGRNALSAAPDAAEEAAKFIRIWQAVVAGLFDMESTQRNCLANQYAEFVLSSLATLEELAVLEQSEHRTRVRRILEQGALASQREDERRRLRILDVTRDCVRDEADERQSIEVQQMAVFVAATRQFVELPAETDLVVTERLERTEWIMAAEEEMFCFIRIAALREKEKLQRLTLEHTAWRLHALTIGGPLAVLNQSVALRRLEGEQRRLLKILWRDEHEALWEWHCEEIQPRLERQLWHTIVRETNERLDIEKEERIGADECFHGHSTIRPLVQQHAAAVEQARRAARVSAQRAAAECHEAELTSRAMLQRSQREEHILLQEQFRRGEEAVLTRLRMEKKRAVEEALLAARRLREQDEQMLKKQVKALGAANSGNGITSREKLPQPAKK
jgi:hypothetical protein